MPGPVLIDLAAFTDSSLTKVAWIIPAHAVGYFGGSVLSGLVFDKVEKKNRFDGKTVLVMAIFTAVFPWPKKVHLMALANFVASVAGGALDVTGSAQMFGIWGDEGGRYMQCLETSMIVGAALGPLVVEPFLLPELNRNLNLSDHAPIVPDHALNVPDHNHKIYGRASNVSDSAPNVSDHALNILSSTLNVSGPASNFSAHFNVDQEPTILSNWIRLERHLDIRVSFGVLGLVAAVLGILFFFQTEIEAEPDNNNEAEAILAKGAKPNQFEKRCLVALSAVFVVLITQGQFSAGTFLTPFVVHSDLHLTKSSGALMTSMFFGTDILGQLLFILKPNVFSIVTNISALLAFVIAGNVLLYFAVAVFESTSGLWVAMATIGFGWSSIYCLTFAFLNQFVAIRAKISSILLAAFCFGQSVVPMLDGFFIEDWPMFFVYSSIFLSVLSVVVFVVMVAMTKKFQGAAKYSV